MTKQEFIGHLFCDYRYGQLKNMIKYQPMEKVSILYDIHVKFTKNVRFKDLEKRFNERFEHERTIQQNDN